MEVAKIFFRFSDLLIKNSEVLNMHGCCGERSFFTKEEKVEMLKEYKDSLEKEAKGVAERIKEMQKE